MLKESYEGKMGWAEQQKVVFTCRANGMYHLRYWIYHTFKYNHKTILLMLNYDFKKIGPPMGMYAHIALTRMNGFGHKIFHKYVFLNISRHLSTWCYKQYDNYLK